MRLPHGEVHRGQAAGTQVSIRLIGVVRTSSTAGSFKIRFAQVNVNVTATILKRDSWIKLTRAS